MSLLSVLEAEAILWNLVTPLDPDRDVEHLTLSEVEGRILAAPITGNLDVPHWDNSAMDGYAVQFADVTHASEAHPIALDIIEEVPAGTVPQRSVAMGQAARILTGSMMPEGADTVVIQENTQRTGDRLSVLTPPKAVGEFVRRKGSFYQAGTPLLAAGTPVRSPEVAVLASVQCVRVPVYRRLKVAILSTGDELVPPDVPLSPGKLVDSNQYALAAVVRGMGAEPIPLGIVPDEPKALEGAIAQALDISDVVLSTGGVSVGDYDYVEQILTALGGTLHIRSVAVKPGKPLTVATFERGTRSRLYFGLPGNPVSALVTTWRFVLPTLKKLSGLPSTACAATFIPARTHQDLRAGGSQETYLWGRVQVGAEGFEFDLATGSHSSGNLINLAGINGLAVVPVGETLIPAGDRVRVMLVEAIG